MTELDLDLDGPAAPPRANGELVFEHPWQSRLFATTMALCESGTITYDEFREGLIAELAHHPDAYWACWQDALEDLLMRRRMFDDEQLTARARQFAEHAG